MWNKTAKDYFKFNVNKGYWYNTYVKEINSWKENISTTESLKGWILECQIIQIST